MTQLVFFSKRCVCIQYYGKSIVIDTAGKKMNCVLMVVQESEDGAMEKRGKRFLFQNR